jgi:hypothetical protein
VTGAGETTTASLKERWKSGLVNSLSVILPKRFLYKDLTPVRVSLTKSPHPITMGRSRLDDGFLPYKDWLHAEARPGQLGQNIRD